MYPPKLEAIISLFESLPEIERRETLVSYADNAKKQEPRPGENSLSRMSAKMRSAPIRWGYISRWMTKAKRISG